MQHGCCLVGCLVGSKPPTPMWGNGLFQRPVLGVVCVFFPPKILYMHMHAYFFSVS